MRWIKLKDNLPGSSTHAAIVPGGLLVKNVVTPYSETLPEMMTFLPCDGKTMSQFIRENEYHD